MSNLALYGRRELWAHRRFVTGVTASSPIYKEVDTVGNKEWVVDVYIGPLDHVGMNVVRDCPVTPYARQVVGDIRQPVLLERSKQGRYTVVGRAKTMPAGAQTPEGSILEPTYHRREYNLAELKALFIPDISYSVEKWGDKLWGDGGPWQDISGTDAFGNVILGADVDPEDVPAAYDLTPSVRTVTRHVLIIRKGWGGSDPLIWGTDPWGASIQKVIENES